MKPVKITVTSITTNDQGQERVELISFGRLALKNNKYYAIYEESEATGFAGTTTTLKWDAEQLIIIRNGSLESRQEFATGLTYNSIYKTPYMEIPLTTATRTYKALETAKGWQLEVEYRLYYAATEENSIKLKIELEEDK